jgi:phosphatidyl-myo-inositol dimannoside synthase
MQSGSLLQRNVVTDDGRLLRRRRHHGAGSRTAYEASSSRRSCGIEQTRSQSSSGAGGRGAVVIVTGDFPPDHGGIQRYCERLAGELSAAGRSVEVVAPDRIGAAAYDATLPYRVRRIAARSTLRLVFEMARMTKAAVRESGAERVIAMSWNPAGIAARLVAPASRITLLAHGSEIARQAGHLRPTALRAVMRGTDVVANSRFTAWLLAERGIAGARIVPCGVDPVDQPASGGRAALPTILSVGRLVRRKGYDRLVEALAHLGDRLPDARLVIAGDGPDRSYLDELARRHGVEARVEFLGAIDDVELARRYAEAWCFAMPSRREGFDVEGFGIVFLEAAMRGVPALGGTGSGAEDAIEHGRTGLLVDPNDAGAIAEALAELLLSPERSLAMGAAARRRALEGYSWRSVTERVMHR